MGANAVDRKSTFLTFFFLKKKKRALLPAAVEGPNLGVECDDGQACPEGRSRPADWRQIMHT